MGRARAVAFLVVLATCVLPRSSASDCLEGVFLPIGKATMRHHRISAVVIGSLVRPMLVYGPIGKGLPCGGDAEFDGRHVTARLRECLADDGSSPRCWCSPSMVRLSISKDCTRLHGAISANGKRHPLVAKLGHCGDGFIDLAHGEECDGGASLGGCASPLRCDDTCHCSLPGTPGS